MSDFSGTRDVEADLRKTLITDITAATGRLTRKMFGRSADMEGKLPPSCYEDVTKYINSAAGVFKWTSKNKSVDECAARLKHIEDLIDAI